MDFDLTQNRIGKGIVLMSSIIGSLYENLWQTKAVTFIFRCGQATVNHLGLPMAVIGLWCSSFRYIMGFITTPATLLGYIRTFESNV
jgi:hypothetical protein